MDELTCTITIHACECDAGYIAMLRHPILACLGSLSVSLPSFLVRGRIKRTRAELVSDRALGSSQYFSLQWIARPRPGVCVCRGTNPNPVLYHCTVIAHPGLVSVPPLSFSLLQQGIGGVTEPPRPHGPPIRYGALEECES